MSILAAGSSPTAASAPVKTFPVKSALKHSLFFPFSLLASLLPLVGIESSILKLKCELEHFFFRCEVFMPEVEPLRKTPEK